MNVRLGTFDVLGGVPDVAPVEEYGMYDECSSDGKAQTVYHHICAGKVERRIFAIGRHVQGEVVSDDGRCVVGIAEPIEDTIHRDRKVCHTPHLLGDLARPRYKEVGLTFV